VMYLRNFPGCPQSGISMPRLLLEETRAWDPFAVLSKISATNEVEVLSGLDTVILNPSFLLNLQPESIAAIRDFVEFRNFQNALLEENEKTLQAKLALYLKRLASEAPKHYGPW